MITSDPHTDRDQHTDRCWWDTSKARWACPPTTATPPVTATPAAETELVDVRDMFVVHTAMLREFRLIPNAVRHTAPGDRKRVARVAAHIDFLGGLLHHHHAGEDELLWPKLRDRVPAAAATLTAVEDQHRRIYECLDTVRHARQHWTTQPDQATTANLADALDGLDAQLRAHLELEEHELLPLTAATLTPTEWDAVGEAAVATMPKPALLLAFGMFAYEADPAVLAGMLASAPLVARLLLPRIAPRAYARRARRVHGTPRP